MYCELYLLRLLKEYMSFFMQICRVEDVNVKGFIEGSVVHFHWVRNVIVKSSGAIRSSGLGIFFPLV